MKKNLYAIIKSWACKESDINETKDILSWVEQLNNITKVNINKINLKDSDFWYYDKEEGAILNKSKSFFNIKGVAQYNKDEIIETHPIIIQDEIGYLGIICKEIKGILYFLIQAKIEPGNINKVQLSPTIQATKSNFTQMHGGSKPPYLEYFMNVSPDKIIVDQIQSEQSSRFYKKRNRNIIIKIDEDIKLLPNYKWVTLGQLKQLMKIDNLVNMDTRTVLSCIPFVWENLEKDELQKIKKLFNDKALFKSIFNNEGIDTITNIYKYINDYKMFNEHNTKIIPLSELNNWDVTDEVIKCKVKHSFSVIYCDIEVEGREVRKWTQPLVKAEGVATFGLLTTVDNGMRKFLVRCIPEIGCFDGIELGPTVQLEPVCDKPRDEITKLFINHHRRNEGVLYDVVLSEEGGRFYHEQNYNIIIEIDKAQIDKVPKGYFWVDYKTLNTLVQINNCLNIQLRNLLSLLEV